MRFAAAVALAAAGAACAASRAAGAEVRTGAGASLRAHAAESLAKCGKTGASCTTDSDCCQGNLSTNIYTPCSGSGAYWYCSTTVCKPNYCQTTG